MYFQRAFYVLKSKSSSRCLFPKFYTSLTSRLLKTPFYDFHVEHGGQMVPFAGYLMPVRYMDQSILESHKHVRSKAGVFDVSHMFQLNVSGSSSISFLESLTPSDINEMPLYSSLLSTLLNSNGGIEDDIMIYRHNKDEFYLVTNAATREKNKSYFKKHLDLWGDSNVQLKELKDRGPLSADILQEHTNTDLTNIKFGKCLFIKLAGSNVHISRTGYTGEDGFEISIPIENAVSILKELLATTKELKLSGLGARDSLRLEAGMCLYGTDIDHTVTPVEASLSWIIGKRRRAEGGFLGDKRILQQLQEGIQQRRIGLIVKEAPARCGAIILNIDGSETIGRITSGCPSPSLQKNIAMGYIKTGYHKKNTNVAVNVRGKLRNATVIKMPWIPNKYYR
ncbi:glycine cleavage system T protein [Pneumocystis murina B123]|uniref:Aminomethyltransferase n=1 Tax=Pneumocystis murina (strain B123) TaxID=1069680 RepID=M7NWP5_PNEMU|nr:glycine cleavage system T protein [Pneumocystis murina B123]EMR11576.1 glycine cleavage system T protein [Pneumocystis murina B123]